MGGFVAKTALVVRPESARPIRTLNDEGTEQSVHLAAQLESMRLRVGGLDPLGNSNG
jgi:hypothetical protein